MEKSMIEDMFLSERICLGVPADLAFPLDEYAEVVYNLANICLLKKEVPFVIACYTRHIFPSMFEGTCLIADAHYIEFLADIAHWRRLKDSRLMEFIYAKYLKNHSLLNNDYVNATFYEWLIRDKQFILPPFSQQDYKEGFSINLIALMHEVFHFVKNFDKEYDALFREHSIDKYVKNTDGTILEGKCDFMGLTILMNKVYDLEQTSNQIVENYFHMIAANCLYKSIIQSHFEAENQSTTNKDLMDRLFATISFLYGMNSLFPDLDPDKLDLNVVRTTTDGIKCITNLIDTRLVDYAEEYNGLPNQYKENIYNELRKEEKERRQQRKFILYPDQNGCNE